MAADNKIIALLREARCTLETWKDVVPAASLCADIDKALSRTNAPNEQAEPAAGERAAFEAWAIEQDINITPSYPRGGQRDYAYMEASYSWRIWQGISRYRAAPEDAERFVFMIECALADIRGDALTSQQQAMRTSLESIKPKTLKGIRACIDTGRHFR